MTMYFKVTFDDGREWAYDPTVLGYDTIKFRRKGDYFHLIPTKDGVDDEYPTKLPVKGIVSVTKHINDKEYDITHRVLATDESCKPAFYDSLNRSLNDTVSSINELQKLMQKDVSIDYIISKLTAAQSTLRMAYLTADAFKQDFYSDN